MSTELQNVRANCQSHLLCLLSSRSFILQVSLRRTHSQNCANIAFCRREISEKCFWNIIFGPGRYLHCYNQDNCCKIMIFVSMLFPKRSAWCLRVATIFFSWKKRQATNLFNKATTSNYSMWLFCRRYEGHLPSVLRDKSFEIMIDFKLGENTYRSQREVPNLLDVITAVCCRREGQNVQRSGTKQIPPIGTIYSMLMNQCNKELNRCSTYQYSTTC